MRHTRTATLAVAGLLALTACSGSNDTSSSTETSKSAASSKQAAPMDAEQVTALLAEKISSAKPATVYTASTDPNDLLGRPGGYASKSDFTDDRAKPDLDDEVQKGGSVEVYDDPAEAEERGKYIADTLGKMKIFGTEYHYLKGGILLRVSGELTPGQAAEYEAALNKL